MMAGAGLGPAPASPGLRHSTMASAATAAHQQRLLRALSYPFDYASDGDAASLATLVTWCEDRKIRALEIDDRAPLRVAGERWDGAFAAYLAELDCPGSWPRDRDACVSWLLWKAVECEYDDDADAIDRDAAAAARAGAGAGGDGIARVAAALGVAADGADGDAALLACAARVAAANDARDGGGPPSAAAVPLGFATGDSTVDEVAQRMRLFYVDDLRDVQDAVTGIIIRAQNYVANPVTNSSLGKVGR